MFMMLIFLTVRLPPSPTLFPYTTLFRSVLPRGRGDGLGRGAQAVDVRVADAPRDPAHPGGGAAEVERLGHRLEHQREAVAERDRKSTRLNSSHMSISYAVFCLKKKRMPHRAVTAIPQSLVSTAGDP